MKINIVYEGNDDRLTPINMAKAICDLMIGCHEDEELWVSRFREMVEHLDVASRYLCKEIGHDI